MTMELSISEQITYCTVRLTCFNDGNSEKSVGTGFIMCVYEKDGQSICILVTNKHVVEGYKKVQFDFCLKNDDDTPNDKKVHHIVMDSDFVYHHPNQDVDLCAFPLGPILNILNQKKVKPFFVPLSMNLIPSSDVVNKLTAMEDIVMVGYPIGLIDTYNNKPIIRKGITATHIKKKYCGKNEFLIDAACYPGSSGSPVFILNEGNYHFENNLYVGDRLLLVGILYAGPQYTASGSIVFSAIPSSYKTSISVPMNLGIAINSNEISVFADYYIDLLNKREQEKLEKTDKMVEK